MPLAKSILHPYIIAAVKTDPDCVGMNGVLVENGKNTKPFEHSLKYESWSQDAGKYTRNPNHLNPIRRSIALKVGFPPVMSGEDNAYSMKIRPLLETEVMIDSVIYYYVQ